MKKEPLFLAALFAAAFALTAADRDDDRDRDRRGGNRSRQAETPAAPAAPRETRPASEARPARENAGRGEGRPSGENRPPAARPTEERRTSGEGAARRENRTYGQPRENLPGGEAVRSPQSRGGVNIYKVRQVPVAQPRRFERPSDRVNDNLRPVEPRFSESGEAIRKRRERRPPEEHRSVMRNPELLRDIRDQQRSETSRDRYYWHNIGGVNYAHYYDDHGTHWYGFYHGPRFYWSRYYANNWWWYDGGSARWVFWWDNYWWWWGPGGAPYVYVDDSYYPYDMGSGQVTVRKAETAAPPPLPPSPKDGRLWVSPDKTRLVQVYGKNSDAFLYDNTLDKPVYLAYLGKDVTKVRFDAGPPVRIILDFKDGTFALYDMQGTPKEPPAGPPPAAEQPPAPESVPPVPETPQGQ